jgi:hypothetical protein
MSGHEAAHGDGCTDNTVPHDQAEGPPHEIGEIGGVRVGQLHPGQRVQACVDGVAHWTGTVETVAVALGVVWIREDGLGERKLLDLWEYQLHPQDPAEG